MSDIRPPVPRPIAEAPRDELGETPLCLHCPEEGGWHAGVWRYGRWWDFSTRTIELHPDFYMGDPLPEAPPPAWKEPLPGQLRTAALWIVTFLLTLGLIFLFQDLHIPLP
jgi:hypothetical protein